LVSPGWWDLGLGRLVVWVVGLGARSTDQKSMLSRLLWPAAEEREAHSGLATSLTRRAIRPQHELPLQAVAVERGQKLLLSVKWGTPSAATKRPPSASAAPPAAARAAAVAAGLSAELRAVAEALACSRRKLAARVPTARATSSGGPAPIRLRARLKAWASESASCAGAAPSRACSPSTKADALVVPAAQRGELGGGGDLRHRCAVQLTGHVPPRGGEERRGVERVREAHDRRLRNVLRLGRLRGFGGAAAAQKARDVCLRSYSSKGALRAAGRSGEAPTKSSDKRASVPQCWTSVAACAGSTAPPVTSTLASASGRSGSGV
jgi:hypothetical protein